MSWKPNQFLYWLTVRVSSLKTCWTKIVLHSRQSIMITLQKVRERQLHVQLNHSYLVYMLAYLPFVDLLPLQKRSCSWSGLLVCLSAGLQKNLWHDFNETCLKGVMARAMKKKKNNILSGYINYCSLSQDEYKNWLRHDWLTAMESGRWQLGT